MQNTTPLYTMLRRTYSEKTDVSVPHSCAAVFLVRDGRGTMMFDSLCTACDRGQLLYLRAGTDLSFLPAENTPLECSILLVSKSFLNRFSADRIHYARTDLLSDISEFRICFTDLYKAQEMEALEHLFELLLLENEAPSDTMMVSSHLLLALFAMITRHYTGSRAPMDRDVRESNRQKLIHRVIDLIHEHYMEDIDLKYLADAVYTSPSYLCRIFREVTGCTLTTYLNRVRLANAKWLLITTDDLIVDIAASCGYNSIPYFNQIFRKEDGITPTEYRRLYRSRDRHQTDRLM